MPSHRADTPARSRRSASGSTGRNSRSERRAPAPPPQTRASLRADTRTSGLRTSGPSTSGQRASGQRPSGHRASGRASLPSISAPQVGIAGVLGIATIAAPISGAMAGPSLEPSARQLPMAAMAPAPAFPALEANVVPGVSALRVVGTDLTAGATVPAKLSAPRTLLVTRAARGSERPVLPGCDGTFARQSFSNGQLPDSILCTLWDPKHRLRADAAIAIAKLNIAYNQRFGRNLCITDSYRTLSAQYRVKAIKPGLAAAPGTSNHGLGLALDLCGGSDQFGTTQYLWMRANGPSYGWDNPSWALPGGGGPTEPWHWEYLAGE